MPVDSATFSGLIIGLASLVGWAVTQTTARNRARREELRYRRKAEMLSVRYIYRLEKELATHDLPLPDKPDGLLQLEEEGEKW